MHDTTKGYSAGDTLALTLRTGAPAASAGYRNRQGNESHTRLDGTYGHHHIDDCRNRQSLESHAHQQRLWQRSVRRYALATIACVMFSALYESQSHGVWSASMVCICAYPLVLGVLPALLGSRHGLSVPSASRELWACGVMTLAMGSCLRGVVEIYGTTSSLLAPYLPVGVGLLLVALVAGIWRRVSAPSPRGTRVSR